jgi:hypothetical protein
VVAAVCRALDRDRLAPERLCPELTETAPADDVDESTRFSAGRHRG